MTDYKAVKVIRNGCEFNFPKGSDSLYVEGLLIGGGGAGGATAYGYSAGGGGAGGVIKGYLPINKGLNCVGIGEGGKSNCDYYINSRGGKNSQLNDIVAYGGGPGMNDTSPADARYETEEKGSGGGASFYNSNSYYTRRPGTALQGNNGGFVIMCQANSWGVGGGGAGGDGYLNGAFSLGYNNGGAGIWSDISGACLSYAGGGGGGGGCSTRNVCGWQGYGSNGGGNGGLCGCCYAQGFPATTCGSGGGGHGWQNGACGLGGDGGNGTFIFRYKKDGSDGIKKSIGGCKYECGDYIIHKFENPGATPLLINQDIGDANISYLAVGGGGGGCKFGGGGGGEILVGFAKLTGETCIKVGCAGSAGGGNGGDSCIGTNIVAKGGKGGSRAGGGASGNGCAGGTGDSEYCMGGGGGVCGQGGILQSCGSYNIGGSGGRGFAGMGGGGGGNCGGHSYDGGAPGGSYSSSYRFCAYGYGGGGSALSYSGYSGVQGYQGIVRVCYPSDGSFGIHSATGGNCCYVCDGYCVHEFTSDGTFTIVS